MTLTRRRFMQAAATAAATAPWMLPSLAHARRGMIPFTYFQWEAIRRGPQRPRGATGHASGMMVALGEGGNALAVARRDQLLLIDTKNAPFGELIKREAQIVPFSSQKNALTLVINTHHHADHTGGNWAFTKDHTVLAHAKVAQRVETQMNRYTNGAQDALDAAQGDDPKSKLARRHLESFTARAADLTASDFKPTEALKSDRETRELAGMKLELMHLDAGHTDTDVAVYFPEENVLHTGDLVFNALHPYCDADGGCSTLGWQQSLSKLIEMCNDQTIVVPGHGQIGDIGALRAQRLYFDRVRELVETARGQGKARDEVTKLAPPDAYASYGHERFWPIVLGFVFDELNAATSEAAP